MLGLVSEALLLIGVLNFVVIFHQSGKIFAERGKLIIVHDQEQVRKNLRLVVLDKDVGWDILSVNIVGKVTDLKRSSFFLCSGSNRRLHQIELLHVLANRLIFLDHLLLYSNSQLV